MKKIIALVLAMCFMPLTSFALADNTPKTLTDEWYVYNTDDFENVGIEKGDSLWGVDGWIPQSQPNPKTMDTTLQSDPKDSSNNVMCISRTSKNTSKNERIYKNLTDNKGNTLKLTGDVKISFKLLETDNNQKAFIFMLRNSDASDSEDGIPGNRMVLIDFYQGKVRNSNTGEQYATYTQDGEWVNVDLILNTESKNFDIYINSVKSNDNPIPFINTSASVTDISRVCFDINRQIDGVTTRYIDDLSVSSTEEIDDPQPTDELRKYNDKWSAWDCNDFDGVADVTPVGSSLWGVDGWTPQSRPNPKTMDSTLEIDPTDDSNVVMKIERVNKNNSANERIYRDFSNNNKVIKATGDVRIDFKFLETNGSSRPFLVNLRNSSSTDSEDGALGNKIINLDLYQGKVRNSSTGEVYGVYPQNGEWVSISIIANVQKCKFDVYVNGVKTNSAPIDFFNTTAEPMDISRICFDINRSISDLVTRYVDDVTLMLEEDAPEKKPDDNDNIKFEPWQNVFSYMNFETATEKNINKTVEGWDDWTLSTVLTEPTMTSMLVLDPTSFNGNSILERNKVLCMHRIEKNDTTNEHAFYQLKDNASLCSRKLTGRVNMSFRINPKEFPSGSFDFGVRNLFSNSVQIGEYMFRVDVNSAGYIEYKTENGSVKIGDNGSFPTSGWSTVRLEMDTDERQAWLYVNDKKFDTPIKYYFPETIDKWNHLAILQFDINRACREQVTVYVDDIAVWQDCLEVNDVADKLSNEVVFTDEPFDSIKKNLTLVESLGEDYKVEWKSDNENAISNSGKVTRRSYPQNVKLTADVIYTKDENIYQNAHCEKEFELVVAPYDNVSPDDILKDICENYLTDSLISSQPLNAISKNINLPTYAPNDVNITWESSDEGYVKPNGEVVIPSYEMGDKEISITANLSYIEDGVEYVAQKQFALIVKADKSDADKIKEAMDDMTWNKMSYEDEGSLITSSIVLPETGLNNVKIKWKSENINVVTNKGVISRQNDNIPVTIKAIFTSGDEQAEKKYNFTVKKSPKAQAEEDASKIIIANSDAIVDGFVLPTVGAVNGLKIKWSSSDENYAKISSTGRVTINRPDNTAGNKNIKLTGKFFVEKDAISIPFEITIKALPPDDELVQAVYDELTWETISLDKINSVFYNLSLVTDYSNGVTAAWESSDLEALKNDGEVINPNISEAEKNVTLKVRIQKNSSYKDKEFNLTIRPFKDENEKLDRAFTALTFGAFHDEVINKVTKDITLPNNWKYGTNIKWESDNDAITVINEYENSIGKVKRSEFSKGDRSSLLKAVISSGELSRSKDFYITVKEQDEYEVLFNHDYEWGVIGKEKFKKDLDGNEWSFPDSTNTVMTIENDPTGTSNKVILMRRNAGVSPSGGGQMMFRNQKGQEGNIYMSGRFFMNDECPNYVNIEGLAATGSQIQMSFYPDGTAILVSGRDIANKDDLITIEPCFSKGEWVNFRVEMNTESQKYNVYINENCITANGNLVYNKTDNLYDSSKGLNFRYAFDPAQSSDVKGYRLSLQERNSSADSIVYVDDIEIGCKKAYSQTLTEAAINFEKSFFGMQDVNNITEDIVFPSPTMNELITITSSNPNVLTKEGKVTQSNVDQKVKITVDFLYDDLTLTKSYDVIVKGVSAEPLTDDESVERDLSEAIKYIKDNCNVNNITSDLPTKVSKYGSAITFEGGSPVVSVNGKINRPTDNDKEIEINVTASKNGAKKSIPLKIIVKKQTTTSSAGRGSSSDVVYVPSGNTNNNNNPSHIEDVLPFDDVPKDYWAYNDILSLYKLDCISKSADNKFNPMNAVKREEFVKMVCEYFNLKNTSGSESFNDVDVNEWYYPYILSSTYFGICLGDDNGNFGIGRSISRQDAATIIYRVVKLKEIELQKGEKRTYNDEQSISDYAKEAINNLSAAGIINGNDQGYVNPIGNITRAEVAKILNSFSK